MPEVYFVKTVRLANMDIGPDGISGQSAAATVPLEITLSSKSATVAGRAFTLAGEAAGGSNIVLVPDPSRGRAAAYIWGSADEYGVFQIRGVTPGRYTVLAYYDEPPCDYYDENALVACRALGRTVVLNEASQATVELRTPY